MAEPSLTLSACTSSSGFHSSGSAMESMEAGVAVAVGQPRPRPGPSCERRRGRRRSDFVPRLFASGERCAICKSKLECNAVLIRCPRLRNACRHDIHGEVYARFARPTCPGSISSSSKRMVAEALTLPKMLLTTTAMMTWAFHLMRRRGSG